MKRIAVVTLVIGLLIGGGGTYLVMSGRLNAISELLDTADGKVAGLQKVIEERDRTLLGYTEYRKFLTAGKKQLAGQTQLLTATVSGNEGFIKYLTTSWLGIKSNGAVKVSYKAEYNFGFDLRPGSYDVRAAGTGIEVIVGRPMLIGTPAVSNLKHAIVSGGLFTDEKLAIIELQQEAAVRVRQQGLDMAKQPAIAALCEKRLIEFLRDFLARQPGVQVVPQITVLYK